MVHLVLILFTSLGFAVDNNVSQNLTFNHLSSRDGLSDPFVNAILQDDDGFLWFCTGKGLNRFDGYEFKTFFHIPGDSNSLVNSAVNCVDIDDSGDLWVGTGHGISKYLRKSNSFKSVVLNGSRQLNTIRAIYVKSDSVIWLGSNEGLIKYNPLDDSYLQYQQDTTNNHSISHNIVRAIMPDSKGNLWIGTFDGLNKFDPLKETFITYKPIVEQEADPINNLIISLQQDTDKDLLWVGTQTGLAKFNMETSHFKVFRNELGYSGIRDNVIKTISGPYNNQLWLGTNEGIAIFEVGKEEFVTYRHNPYLNISLSNDVVKDIYQDRSGVIWIGTNDGLSSFNLKRKQFNFYPITKLDRYGETTGTDVNVIFKQQDVALWLGGSSGLVKVDSKGNEKWYTQQMGIGLESNIINDIYSDHRGNIWICTTGGLSLYHPGEDNFLHFDIQSDPRASKYVSTIIEYKPDNYLVGSSGTGLLKFETNSSLLFNSKLPKPEFSFLRGIQVIDIASSNGDEVWIAAGKGEIYKFGSDDSSFEKYFLINESLEKSVIEITCLFPDENDQLLAATRNGAYKLDRQTNRFIKIKELGDIDIKGIEKDNDTGRLWVATTNSIIELDETRTIAKRYTVGMELPIKSFVPNSTFKDEDGKLYFGGIDGYISFNPNAIHEDDFILTPLITKIIINNSELNPEILFNGRKLIDKVVYQLDELNLRYNENSIEFSFSPFHFASPKSNQFAYRLENFDDDWRTTDGIYPKALYSNLKPGDYLFKVKAANPDGIWSNETRDIKIRIDTPWWASTYAFLSYILAMIVVGVLAARQTMIKTKLKNELKYEQFQHERDEELHQLKMKFFTNVSHEIRTPLTLILGPVDLMIQRITDKAALGQLNMMKRNASRLLRLINQIMDMRKLEKGNLELFLENGDLVQMVEDVHANFAQLAKIENISYSFSSNQNELLCRFDRDKMDKILFNLITNAFKFSGKNGKVAVELSCPIKENDKDYVEISVRDSGVGIPEDQMEHIFERFYQVEGIENHIQKGTGIGLSMSNDYARLHGGRILIESNVEEGSVFRVLIPFLPIESNDNPDVQLEQQLIFNEPMEPNVNSVVDIEYPADKELPLILIVEDNHDMRHFIRDNLAGHYQILEAENGLQGVEMARKRNPQLIISDVMMPLMDGLELCHKIKSEFDTSHIPVILLTAKNSPESVLKGLKEGADDYVTKPFFIKQLRARIENLINCRKVLIDKFNKGSLIHPSDITVTGIDENFMSEIVDIIEEHISETELNIVFLAKSIGMSHSAMYKKIKSITGLSGNEFIRNIRLKRAGRLLKSSNTNISDVIYQVGFNNRSYFSKCFHEMYNMTPTNYASRE